MKELMEKFKKAFGVPEKERIKLGKEIWKIAADEVYIIGVVGLGPAVDGRARRQEQHGQHPVAPVQQPGRQDAGDLASGDVLLEELSQPEAPGSAVARRR